MARSFLDSTILFSLPLGISLQMEEVEQTHLNRLDLRQRKKLRQKEPEHKTNGHVQTPPPKEEPVLDATTETEPEESEKPSLPRPAFVDESKAGWTPLHTHMDKLSQME